MTKAVDAALGAAADGAADVCRGGDVSARGEDEGLDGRHEVIKPVDLTLYLGYGALGDAGHLVELVLASVGGQIAADGEELVL